MKAILLHLLRPHLLRRAKARVASIEADLTEWNNLHDRLDPEAQTSLARSGMFDRLHYALADAKGEVDRLEKERGPGFLNYQVSQPALIAYMLLVYVPGIGLWMIAGRYLGFNAGSLIGLMWVAVCTYALNRRLKRKHTRQ